MAINPGDPVLLRDLPAMVRSELDQLPPGRQTEFFDRYLTRRKRRWVAWLFWLVGWHFAYLRKGWLELGYLVAIAAVVGLVWWVVEAFRLHGRVRAWNSDRAIETMRDLKIISGER